MSVFGILGKQHSWPMVFEVTTPSTSGTWPRLALCATLRKLVKRFGWEGHVNSQSPTPGQPLIFPCPEGCSTFRRESPCPPPTCVHQRPTLLLLPFSRFPQKETSQETHVARGLSRQPKTPRSGVVDVRSARLVRSGPFGHLPVPQEVHGGRRRLGAVLGPRSAPRLLRPPGHQRRPAPSAQRRSRA